jgi:hypothetical protein
VKQTLRTNQSIKFLLFSFLVILLSCNSIENKVQNKQVLVDYFNSKGRYDRFTNCNLNFGESLNSKVKGLLLLDSNSKIKYYRSCAFSKISVEDTINYFIYGTSVSDSFVSQLRIRSLKNKILTDDQLIFDFNKKSNLSFDYRVDDNMIRFYSRMENGKAHYSEFLLNEGLITNISFIPESIYRRLDFIPKIGQKVRIYDDFSSKKVEINGIKSSMTGIITQQYGDKCGFYMIIRLDKNDLVSDPFVATSNVINNPTQLFKLINDQTEERTNLCITNGSWPIEEPVLIKNKVYIEFK